MKSFKNLNEIRVFCRENNISIVAGDKKNDLLIKIKEWEAAQIASEFTGIEFGQLYKLEPVMIKYLTKCFKREKKTYENWIEICKDKKIID